jgi:hypothetical protein
VLRPAPSWFTVLQVGGRDAARESGDVIFSGDKVFFGVAVFSGDGDGRWSSKRGRRRCPGCGVVGDGG